MDARMYECDDCKKKSDVIRDIFSTERLLSRAKAKALLSGDPMVVECRHCKTSQIIKLEGKLVAVSA
jgi:hypothetical protein